MSASPAQGPVRQEILSLRLDSAIPDAGRASAWVCEPVWIAVERLQGVAKLQPKARVAVVATTPPAGLSGGAAALVNAGVAALRGLLHSLTPELGERVAVNLVVASPGQEEEVEAALSFLEGADAQWVRGATLDLREGSCR